MAMTMGAGKMSRTRRITFLFLQSLVIVGFIVDDHLVPRDLPRVVDAAIFVLGMALQVAAIYVIWPRRTE